MAWRPAPDTVLRVTGRLWNFIWVENNEGQRSPCTGVGQVVSAYSVGFPPHLFPVINEAVYAACVTTESSGLWLIYMSPVLPPLWPFGYHVWVVRWLHGG